MKQVFKYIGLTITVVLLLLLASVIQEHQGQRHQKPKASPNDKYHATIKRVTVTQTMSGTNTQNTFKIVTDKNKHLEGKTKLDIAPGDRITYTKTSDNSKTIQIQSRERELKGK